MERRQLVSRTLIENDVNSVSTGNSVSDAIRGTRD